LTQAGTGTVVMNEANTYSGVTSIDAGTMSVGSVGNAGGSSNLGSNALVNIGAAAVGGTLLSTGAGETGDKGSNLAGTTGGATITQSGASGLLRFTGNVTGTAAAAMTSLTIKSPGASAPDCTTPCRSAEAIFPEPTKPSFMRAIRPASRRRGKRKVAFGAAWPHHDSQHSHRKPSSRGIFARIVSGLRLR